MHDGLPGLLKQVGSLTRSLKVFATQRLLTESSQKPQSLDRPRYNPFSLDIYLNPCLNVKVIRCFLQGLPEQHNSHFFPNTYFNKETFITILNFICQ